MKQQALSNFPKKDEFLIEIYKTKDFSNIFVFTLDGKFVNEGIAFLWALRLAKLKQSTFSITANDFGFSLTTAEDYDYSIIKKEADYFLDNKKLEEDLEKAINFSELTKRRFKNIAQISGLVNQNNPTKTKTSSQLQISSSLFYDVFTKYEEGHLLIKQSHKEVKEYQLENKRISRSLERLKSLKILLNEIKIEKIVLTRPAVEAGENLGFLPGDLQQKVDPYLRPLFDSLHSIFGFERTNSLIDKGIIEVAPLAFMRGRTLDNSLVILDEAQNTTCSQMRMFLTRLGERSKMVVNGDITQIDLKKDQESGLIEASRIFSKTEGIKFCFLTVEDVVRHPLVQKIIEAYQ